MLNTVIDNISESFIREANDSPNLLRDMAQMERYIAESYNERILVELIQNADDAGSSKVELSTDGETIFFSNNGKTIDGDDVMAMSSSGFSSKKRGETIGYRGVGFKSSSYLSDEILIYSDDSYFTYSKTFTSKILNRSKGEVPIIRIPFSVNLSNIDEGIRNKVQILKDRGFTTIFIFKNANMDKLNVEVEQFDEDYMIFLRHLLKVRLVVEGFERMIKVERNREHDKTYVKLEADKLSRWLVRSNESSSVSLAFSLDEDMDIVPSSAHKSVFHCYLPTLEKVGLPFKVNSDFSTDPSRKHLTFDEITTERIKEASSLLYSLVRDTIYDKEKGFENIVGLVTEKTGFSRFSMLLWNEFTNLLQQEWLLTNNKKRIKPSEYFKTPKGYEASEFDFIRSKSSYVNDMSVAMEHYENIPNLTTFMDKLTNKSFSYADWCSMLSDKTFVEACHDRLLGKMYGSLMSEVKVSFALNKESIPTINSLYIKNSKSNAELLKDYSHNFEGEFIGGILEIIPKGTISWFDNVMQTDFISSLPKNGLNNYSIIKKNSVVRNQRRIESRVNLSKWRSVEVRCVDYENQIGNKAKDVSKQNLGYDIESLSPDGTMKYIEVKSLSKNKSEFTMTNNEYTSAVQHGDDYYLYIVTDNDDEFEIVSIKNPLKSIYLEKRVRQWEWFCDEYSGEKIVINYGGNIC